MKTIALLLASGLSGIMHAAEQRQDRAALPLKEVILYSSGVGYFERAGQIDGNGAVDLRFRTEDINDLLKSMVVQDFGGTVGVISYDSRDPISKTLQSFAIDLTSNPSMRDILNQMRGEKVNVLWPQQTSGTVVGVERRVVEVEKDKRREEDFLNLFSGGRLQSIPFNQIREIQLENEGLQKELDEALTTLAKGHDTEKKTVTLTFAGEGKRDVNISYIVEAPVWKTSYRLVLDDKGGGFMQGWAIVENTGDDDWENVRLSLVSGRPISFKMDLYQPLYAPRPTVQPELYLSLRPQVYSDAMESEEFFNKEAKLGVAAADAVKRQFAPATAASPLPALQKSEGRLEYYAGAKVTAAGKGITFGYEAGTAGAASGETTAELFQYSLNMPVSIARQKSAMLPILTEKVEGNKLSIYNQGVQAKNPLNGFRLKNTTELHLMQGPITVFDGGSYAGDARIEDLAPGQDRLISYALDLKMEVEPKAKSEPETLVSVAIRHGTFQATKKLVEEKTYNARNKDTKKKTVLIEHPVRQDWKLESPSEPTERTRDVYRFKMEVEAGKSGSLVVKETNQRVEEVYLTTLPVDTFAYYLRSGKVSDKVKDALRKVADFRKEISQLQADRKMRDDRLQEIGQEQTRIRENMARLNQNAELYQRYVKKFDEQETEFERLREEAAKLKEAEAQKQREFNDYVANLDLE